MTTPRGGSSRAVAVAGNTRPIQGAVTAAPTSRATQQPSPTAQDPIVNIKRRQVEELRKSQRRLRDHVMGYIAAREVVGSCDGLRDAINDGLRQIRSGGSPGDETLARMSSGLQLLKDHGSAGALRELGRTTDPLVDELENALRVMSESLEPLSWQAHPEYGTALSDSARAAGIAHDRAAQIARHCRENSQALMESIASALDRIFDRMKDTTDATRAEQSRPDFVVPNGERSTSVEQSPSPSKRLRPGVNTIDKRETSMDPGARGRARVSRPIRILFLAANPAGTDPLGLDQEIRAIDQALREAAFREQFQIEQQWAVQIDDLQKALLRFQPDIVHFSGHGTETSEIVLMDASGAATAVPRDALSRLFDVLHDNIRCVVLNACYSAEQADAIAEHIDCVVGMTKAVGDDAAIRFATAFYRGLGYGRSIETAFKLGTNEIGLQDLPDADTPKLVAKRLNAGQLILVVPE